MFTFKPVLVCCIFCINVTICRSAMRTFQVEQIFYNKIVLDNLLAEYSDFSSALCSAVCQQENCECFGFNSITQMCRVHAFCRPDNILLNESGWKYYRSRAGWETFINSEYLAGVDAVTWNEAMRNCTMKGAKLVEVESSEENAFMCTMAVKMTKSVWLGGTDHQVEGKWVWQSTNSELSYNAWEKISGQPNNLNNQDCLCLDRNLGLAWSDEECWLRYQYFCERELFTDS